VGGELQELRGVLEKLEARLLELCGAVAELEVTSKGFAVR
jgi:hypothetical protein